MKKITVHILCCTGITLIILAVIAAFLGARFLFISSVFESFLANIIIHAGLLLLHRFESQYALLEYTLDISYTVTVVLVSGAVFDWYRSTPIWMLVVMSVIIYLIGMLLGIFHMRKEIEEINHLLKQQNAPK